MRFLTIICIFFLFAACENSKTQHTEPIVQIVETYVNPLEKTIDSLRRRILIHGDNKAYHELSSYYNFHHNQSKELFYYSYEMATKYHNGEAYFDLYNILFENVKDEKGVNSCTYYMAMYYLLLAYEKGDMKAKATVKYQFGRNAIPKAEKFKKNFCYYCFE